MAITSNIRQVLSRRDPALLLAGQSISNLGDGISYVAFTIFVIDTYRSPTDLTIVVATRTAAMVAALLFAGVLVDRLPRRSVLLVSDGARGLLMALLVALIATHLLRFGSLVAISGAFGLFDALFGPASTSLMPEIVPEDLLMAMNSMRPLSNQVMGGIVGPALGGILAVWSTPGALAIDAGSFFVSFTALALMSPTPRPSVVEGRRMFTDIREGLRYVRTTPWIWMTLVGAGVVNAFIFVPGFVFVNFLMRHTLHASKAIVGLALALGGVSGAVATLVTASMRMPRRRIRVMWSVWIVSDIAMLLVAFATHVWMAALMPLLATPGLIAGNVIWETTLQSETPKDLLGRVSSVDWFFSMSLSPIGIAVAGLLIGHIGLRTYFLWAVGLTAVPQILATTFSRRLTELDVARVRAGSPSFHAPVPTET